MSIPTNTPETGLPSHSIYDIADGATIEYRTEGGTILKATVVHRYGDSSLNEEGPLLEISGISNGNATGSTPLSTVVRYTNPPAKHTLDDIRLHARIGFTHPSGHTLYGTVVGFGFMGSGPILFLDETHGADYGRTWCRLWQITSVQNAPGTPTLALTPQAENKS